MNPVDVQEEHVLADGTTLSVRPIRPEDAAEVRRGFAALSPTSRYRRFFGGISELSDETLRYLTTVDDDHVAIVAVVLGPDLKTDRGVGVARFVRAKGEREVAEAAVTVVDDMQRKGVGRILLTALAAVAKDHGVRRFRAEVLASNTPMRALLEEIHAAILRDDGDTLTCEIPLDPPPEAHGSVLPRLLREAASSLAVLLRNLPPERPKEPT